MRLIDADELRRKMCYKCIDTDEETEKGRVKWDSGLWIRYKVFEDTLIHAPTVDAVGVVRCKDCKYYEETDSRIGTCLLTISGAEVDGFCAWGEWRGDGDDV